LCGQNGEAWLQRHIGSLDGGLQRIWANLWQEAEDDRGGHSRETRGQSCGACRYFSLAGRKDREYHGGKPSSYAEQCEHDTKDAQAALLGQKEEEVEETAQQMVEKG
jgi:hypothetical protein